MNDAVTVLILAQRMDPHVDRIVEELNSRGDVPVFRTDLSDFPQRLALDAQLGPEGWTGTLATEYREVRLEDIRSVWYRHPSQFDLPDGMSHPERRHAAAEARVGVSGVLSSLDALWVNHPAREADALKPRQLDVTRRCGLRVPETLVTNMAEGVRKFAAEVNGPLAGKTLAAAALMESGRAQIAYTRRLELPDLADLGGVEVTAHMFQRFVDNKAFEVRVTVVGDKLFPAAIHAGSDAARVDFRADYDNLTYSIIEPPERVVVSISAFMRSFGLVFGAFDFAVTHDGEWVMFECNPPGAYGWIEDELGFPITATIADVLVEGAI